MEGSMSKYLLGTEETEQLFREVYGMDEKQIEGWRNQFEHKEPPPWDERKANEYAINRPIALAKNDGNCVYCGKPADSVDHIMPRSRGGSDTIDNLAPACMDCNRRKKDKLDWKPGV
jgi:hypothetical protein